MCTVSIAFYILLQQSHDVEVAYPKIFTSDESPHTIIIHFIKKHRTLYSEVDRYTQYPLKDSN